MNEKSIERSEIRFLSCSGSQKTAPSPAFQAPSPVGRGKRAAFTLAEVLITLGIIGVVAAMTLPTLIQNYQEKQRVSRLKTTFSILSQAYQMAINEYGDISQWDVEQTFVEKDNEGNNVLDVSGQNLVRERFAKYLKLADEQNIKFNKSISLSGTEIPPSTSISNGDNKPLYLANGTVVQMGWMSPKEPQYKGDLHVYWPEKNLQTGVNEFFFYITPTGIVPSGLQNDINRDFKKNCDRKDAYGKGRTQGRGCAAWVIFNENMDYLHCDDLSWDGKKKCK